ncbi:hydantoinase B/oxoprolinase family protein [Microvirga antarctica]|uniref:hydantoinase B/oxoprolinase family protein n=1 Tax=Microvirga antarctica TaxID=2819233 RepID=UPI001B303B91|nr:hydantoinase B/oxoprolinase family protein [Microvirga antarctica]
MKLDPVTLEILATKFAAAAEEMSYFLKRTGRSQYVKEAADFSTALVDTRGKFYAYPRNIGVSGFFDLDCGPTIAAVGHLEPGDVIITNHPYMSSGLATHLPDFNLVQPYFHDGRIVSYGWSFVHSADVGGRVPSSISPSNFELFQEGMLIPPMKLVKRGEMNKDAEGFLRANCRTPDANMGDIRAMLAALHLGERRVARIIAQHGIDTFEAAIPGVLSYTAVKAREAFRSIPDGTFEFWDYIDDDLVSALPLRIRLKLTIDDGLLHLDFTGSDPQVQAAYNLPTAGKRHSQMTAWLTSYALTRDPTLPLNSGMLEPVTIYTERGSLLNPEFPAAVGVRHAIVHRVMDATNGALAQALPDFMPAGCAGIIIPVVLAEPEDSNGRRNVSVVQPMVGGGGAHNGGDGADGRHSGPVNIGNNPLETTEANADVTILSYAMRIDSGGAGEWRGGSGAELTFSPHQSGSQVLGRGMDRFRFVPWGLAGGLPGLAARTIVNRGRPDEHEVGKLDMVELQAGDTITILTPGGGGYGDPLKRDPQRVLKDVRGGFVSAESALRDYGVHIADDRVDKSATTLRRSEMVAARARDPERPFFAFGRERDVWDAVFDDTLLSRISAALLTLPLGARTVARRVLWAALLAVIERNVPFAPDALAHARVAVERELALLEARVVKPALLTASAA